MQADQDSFHNGDMTRGRHQPLDRLRPLASADPGPGQLQEASGLYRALGQLDRGVQELRDQGFQFADEHQDNAARLAAVAADIRGRQAAPGSREPRGAPFLVHMPLASGSQARHHIPANDVDNDDDDDLDAVPELQPISPTMLAQGSLAPGASMLGEAGWEGTRWQMQSRARGLRRANAIWPPAEVPMVRLRGERQPIEGPPRLNSRIWPSLAQANLMRQDLGRLESERHAASEAIAHQEHLMSSSPRELRRIRQRMYPLQPRSVPGVDQREGWPSFLDAMGARQGRTQRLRTSGPEAAGSRPVTLEPHLVAVGSLC